MSNLTLLEGDAFSNFDPEETYRPTHGLNTFLMIIYVLEELLKLLVCAGSAGASVFLIYVILKFDRLRSKTNIYLLHYAIGCTVDALIVPIFMLVHQAFFGYNTFLCIITQVGSSTCMIFFIFGTAVGVYWFLQSFKSDWMQRFKNFQIYFTVVLYVICVVKLVITGSACIFKHYFFSTHFLIAVYFILLTIIIALNVVTYKKELNSSQSKTKYQLFIASYIVLSYFPLFFYTMVLYITYDSLPRFIENFFEYTYFFTEIFAYSSPIVVVYLLGRKNKYFKIAYTKAFKRSLNNYEDDVNEESEDENVQNNTNHVNGNVITNPLCTVIVP